ncbi:hypothetical protein QA634_19845 [Methylobacterium sp. CB376]|uniref:hypothetical protein n=1 Tax=unclassified Methylobacterium TaxID=2615210 RepID=UPI001237271B|nr:MULTISPECIES: hypothetical protein [Methylobacterium]WFT77571.1 hypothetical protein QA634_19845 [Methylobacterium nodulans]
MHAVDGPEAMRECVAFLLAAQGFAAGNATARSWCLPPHRIDDRLHGFRHSPARSARGPVPHGGIRHPVDGFAISDFGHADVGFAQAPRSGAARARDPGSASIKPIPDQGAVCRDA